MTEQRTQDLDPPAGPDGSPRGRGVLGRVRGVRARVRRNPRANLVWRIAVGVIGAVVLVVGIIAIPYPGPGWLIVFAGLGILASEFTWAARLLHYARVRYDTWMAWIRRQPVVVQLLFALLTFLVVVATIWLLNGFALVAGWVGLDGWTWLESPLFA